MEDRTIVSTRGPGGTVLVARVVLERRAGKKVSGEWFYLLFGSQFLIGREEGNEIRIIDDRVSRKHCLIKLGEDSVRVADLGSTNGTYRNEVLIEDEIILENKDQLDVGRAVIYRVRLCFRNNRLSSVRLFGGGEVYFLAGNEFIIGKYQERDSDVDLMIYDPLLKERHCRIEHFYNDNFIVSLAMDSMVRVNGKEVKEIGLRDGDLVELGGSAFRWQVISLT